MIALAAGAPRSARALPRWLRALAPAAMISVGYMDPGNWATDLEGASRFGYALLWVLIFSNVLACLLQAAAARLGVGAGLDLAAACRRYYSPPVSFTLWLLAEVAIIACDLAEVLGSAIALQMLFHIPLVLGALLTALDVFIVLALQKRGRSTLEALVAAMVVSIAVCLGAELFLLRPQLGLVATGLVPRLHGAELYVAIGILGATVMPHNLYLHSSLVRLPGGTTFADRKASLRRGWIGTSIALQAALAVNVAILVVSAAAFGQRGDQAVDLRDAPGLLAPVVGTSAAAVLFAVGLLASGQSATITGTLAGQIVMEGFVHVRLAPALRRLITRSLAIVPAVVVLAAMGEGGAMPLLVASQVVLSLQLPFAVVPLLRLTGDRSVMGPFAAGSAMRWAGATAALVVLAANAMLLAHLVDAWSADAPWSARALGTVAVGAAGFLAYVAFVPLRRGETAAQPGAAAHAPTA